MNRYQQQGSKIYDRKTGYTYSAETEEQARYLRRRLEEVEELKKELQDAITDLEAR